MIDPLRLSESDARTLLLVQAVEETDQEGVLLSPRARAAASRRVFDEAPGPDDDRARLRVRASLLADDLMRAAPALARVLKPPASRGAFVVAVIAAAGLSGALTNLIGSERHVSVLAFPLAGILLWNLVVYAARATRAVKRIVARFGANHPPQGRLASVGRWLEGVRMAGLARRLGGSTRSVAVTAAVQRFQIRWLETAASLSAARARVALHFAALAMALGAVVGMYVSGIAFEYRATWESTWLDSPAVQGYLDLTLGPASRVLNIPVPDVAPIRGPSGDGSAEPWIHLWGTTLALFVMIPRAALALIDGLTAARLSRWLPVRLEESYVRRALQSGRGAATIVGVIYYSCAPDVSLRERLHRAIQEEAGARAVIRDDAELEYGDPPERFTLPEEAPGSGLVVVVFTLAQTPEAEVHGEFLEDLRERLDAAGWRMMVVLETATYRKRVGSDERVRERRATWERLLSDLRQTAIDLA
jgi:hypothetical protein